MGIETKYDYIYYTVLNEDWFDEAERILTTELTTERIINAINKKLQRSRDSTINMFRVDYSTFAEEIDDWIRMHNRHKDRPIFVQIERNQPIVRSGSGTLFVFYEKQEDDDDNVFRSEYINNHSPDGHYWGSVDALAGAGGRL